jgi:hypothetical protein
VCSIRILPGSVANFAGYLSRTTTLDDVQFFVKPNLTEEAEPCTISDMAAAALFSALQRLEPPQGIHILFCVPFESNEGKACLARFVHDTKSQDIVMDFFSEPDGYYSSYPQLLEAFKAQRTLKPINLGGLRVDDRLGYALSGNDILQSLKVNIPQCCWTRSDSDRLHSEEGTVQFVKSLSGLPRLKSFTFREFTAQGLPALADLTHRSPIEFLDLYSIDDLAMSHFRQFSTGLEACTSLRWVEINGEETQFIAHRSCDIIYPLDEDFKPSTSTSDALAVESLAEEEDYRPFMTRDTRIPELCHRNRILGQRVREAALNTLYPARILLNDQSEHGRSPWASLPREVQFMILRGISGQKHVLSKRQWTALEMYATDRGTLSAAAEKSKNKTAQETSRNDAEQWLVSLGLSNWEANPGEAIAQVLVRE